MKRMVKFFTLIVSLLLLAMPVLAQSGETPMTRFLEANGAVTCEASPGFQCVDITVPLDHTNPDNGETIDISFAVIPAGNPEARRGMFVTVVGGPGLPVALSFSINVTVERFGATSLATGRSVVAR